MQFDHDDKMDNILPQDEEKMEEQDKQALQRARECQEHGESIVATIKDPKNYQPFLDSLRLSVMKRESVLGRYNHLTAQSYSALGDIYLQMKEPRAVVMYRTCFRIHTFLYGKCNGHISGAFRDVLCEQRGLSQRDIEEVRADVLQSMKFEMEGDLLRRYGDFKAAVREYQKAARVEEFAFGRDNPDLACICRKMACLTSIRKGVTDPMVLDFEQADRMGHKWVKTCKDFLFPSISAYIRKGDKFYESLLYGHAVGEYLRATMPENNLDRKSKSGKSGKHKSGKKKDQRQTEDMAEELRLLLAGKLPPKNIDISGSQHQSSEPGAGFRTDLRTDSHRAETRMPFRGTGHRRSEDIFSPQPAPMMDTGLFDETPSFKSSPKPSSRVTEAIKRFEREQTRPTDKPPAASSPPPATPKAPATKSTIPAPPKASPSPSVKSTRSSKSAKKRRGTKPNKDNNLSASFRSTGTKPRESLSESSLMTFMKAPSYLEPKKPKSDSYISMIAQQTTKIAKSHLRSQLQRSRSGSSKDKSTSKTSFFSSLRKDRSSKSSSTTEDKTTVKESLASQLDTEERAPQETSSSYHFLASPPMTPYHHRQGQKDTDDGKKTLEHFLTTDSVEAPSFNKGEPLASPSKRTIKVDDDTDIDQDESIITDSNNTFEHRAFPQFQSPDDYDDGFQDDDDEESTEPLKLPTESSSILGDFFADEEQQESAPPSSYSNLTDTRSVVTSDESIKERFLSETAQMTAAVLQHSNNGEEDDEEGSQQPSLVELVAHVQRMSHLLQRQTFRLQHKLGDAPRSSRSMEGEIEQLPLDLPHGTVELCKEVERLFENCDDILEQAFARLDDNSVHSRKNKKNVGALEEYRKTFALEQVFLNDLRKGVTDVLAQYRGSATEDGGQYSSHQGNSLSSSGDNLLFDLPGFSSSNNFDSSAGSILEESMLSVVFEDNTSKSPSDQTPTLKNH